MKTSMENNAFNGTKCSDHEINVLGSQFVNLSAVSFHLHVITFFKVASKKDVSHYSSNKAGAVVLFSSE